jgi:hypothetical protein
MWTVRRLRPNGPHNIQGHVQNYHLPWWGPRMVRPLGPDSLQYKSFRLLRRQHTSDLSKLIADGPTTWPGKSATPTLSPLSKTRFWKDIKSRIQKPLLVLMQMQHLNSLWGTKFHTSNYHWPLLIVRLSSLLIQSILFSKHLMTGKSKILHNTFAFIRSTTNI